MLIKFKIFFAAILLLITTFFLVSALSNLWIEFTSTCPNIDVLSWDANLRYRDVIDIKQEIDNGNYTEPIMYALRSPTWPTLRQQISLFIFSIVTQGPHPIADVSISFIFFCLIFPSILLIALDLTHDWLRASITLLFCTALILYSREMPVYSLSSMLETQGMFFLLWSSYFLYKLYEQQRWRRFLHTPGISVSMHKRKRYFSGLLFSSFGLFHTKYPYGLMLVLSILAFEFVRHPQRFLDFIIFSFNQHYKGIRRWIIYGLASFAIILVLVVVLPQIHPGLEFPFKIHSKFLRLVVWLLTLAVFIDLNIYIWRFRVELAHLFDTAFRQIYFACILPTIAWLILLPDRMGSIIGTQQHKQDAAQSFSTKLFTDVFHQIEPFILILILGAFSLLALWIVRVRTSNFKEAFADFFSRPLVAVLSSIIIQFIILEILTGNKQLRHIYHLMPAFIMTICILAMRLPRIVKFSDSNWSLSVYALTRISYLLIPLSVFLFLPKLAEWKLQANASQESNIWNFLDNNLRYTEGRKICYTGRNPDLFEPVRWFAEKVPADKNYVFINYFHNESLRHPGRLLASDFDVLFRTRTLHRGSVRNDNDYLVKSWDEFDQALITDPFCNRADIEATLQPRLKKLNIQIRHNHTLQRSIHSPILNMTAEACLHFYDLKRPPHSL